MSRTEIPAHWTPVQTAAWQTVHEYVDKRTGNRGAAALGPKLGKSGASLSNEVNPDVPTHKHGLEDSITEQLITDDYRQLKAYAAELHHVAVALPSHLPASDVELLTQFADWQGSMGHTCELISQALEKGQVMVGELALIKASGYSHIGKFFQFIHRLEQIAEASRG